MHKTVFVIEDHPPFIDLYKALFNKMDDIEVCFAVTGDGGLEKVKSMTPDLIILDYNLPNMNGVTICKELRKIKKFKAIPIIAVSSSPIKGNKEKIFTEAGFAKLLEKPIKVRPFMKLIMNILFQHST